MFLRNLFSLNVYSTADKILYDISCRIEQKMLRLNIRYRTKRTKHHSVYFGLHDLYGLRRTLGDLLEKTWERDTYKLYQAMTDADKGLIRKCIADEYFNLLHLTDEVCRKSKLKLTVFSHRDGDEEYCFRFNLAKHILNTNENLYIALEDVLVKAKNYIEVKSNQKNIKSDIENNGYLPHSQL